MATAPQDAPVTTSRADGRADAADRVSTVCRATTAAIDLYWLPLGAGGSALVRCNGWIYERLHALRERRRPLALYHAALEVRIGDERSVIELTPVPDRDAASRGVVREGPVGTRWLGRARVFRYELRCWRGGAIPDVEFAVDSPQRLTDDVELARAVLAGVAAVPMLVWGRDERRTGEMWNSNSVVSWLLTASAVPLDRVGPPAGGRAPGWHAGVVVARHPSSGGVPGTHRSRRAARCVAFADYRAEVRSGPDGSGYEEG